MMEPMALTEFVIGLIVFGLLVFGSFMLLDAARFSDRTDYEAPLTDEPRGPVNRRTSAR
jgi:hypothetical protein